MFARQKERKKEWTNKNGLAGVVKKKKNRSFPNFTTFSLVVCYIRYVSGQCEVSTFEINKFTD